MFLLLFYISFSLLVTLYCTLYNLVKVRTGSPPLGLLVIAYKYSSLCKDRNFKFVGRSRFSGKALQLLKICYSSLSKKKLEFAEGIILNVNGDLPCGTVFLEAQKAGLGVLKIPAISHAVFVEFPVYFSFSLTKLIAVLIGYPRINSVLKAKNLCGYPVLEVYSESSILIMVPLMRQDDFVVPEAENIVFGKTLEEKYGDPMGVSSKTNLAKGFSFETSLAFLDSSKNQKLSKSHKRIMKG